MEGKVYNGKEITLTSSDIKVMDGSKELVHGTDYYIVSYKNNVKKGTATAVIRGLGEYGGTKDVKFKISSKGLKWFF